MATELPQLQPEKIISLSKSVTKLMAKRNLTYQKLASLVFDTVMKASPDELPQDIDDGQVAVVKSYLKNKGLDVSTMNKIVRSKTNRSNIVAYSMYIGVYIIDNELYEHNFQESIDMRKEPFVASVQEAFQISGHQPKLSALKYAGIYRFYYPFFEDPKNQIMEAQLMLGDISGNNGAFDATLTQCFRMNAGHRQPDVELSTQFVGKFVPMLTRAFCTLHSPRNDGFMSICFENEEAYPEKGSGVSKVRSFSGTILAAVGSPSSAWPFIAFRTSPDREEFTPRVIPRSELTASTSTSSRRIRAAMARGAVNWQPSSVRPPRV